MVKITEKSLEGMVDDNRLTNRLTTMYKLAHQMFEDVKNEWADTHPHNIQKKYLLEMERPDHPSGRKPILGVGFSLWVVRPVNGSRRHELEVRAIDVYPALNKVSVKNPKYFDDAVQLAESYEKEFAQEFTVEKNYPF